MVEKITHRDIPDALLKEAGQDKFFLYPIAFNGILFHKDRWKQLDEARTEFWGVVANGKLQAALEFSYSDYDTRLLGVKAGTIQYIFTDPQLDKSQKVKAWLELISSFQSYRQREGIKFCFTALNNWEVDLSLLLQQQGFLYILTWGKCFIQKVNPFVLPAGYNVRLNKEEKDLSQVLDMADSYFRGGRFYLDPKIGAAKGDRVYKDLITNSFADQRTEFAMLYNSEGIPVGCFLCPAVSYQLEERLDAYSLRLLVFDKKRTEKGIASVFLAATSDLLLKKRTLLESGIEMHNLPSLKIHSNAGYKINYIFSAYHSWL
ncbi:MAG: hypothetical protein ABIR30_09825 [Chitinophagaceae bacterium]